MIVENPDNFKFLKFIKSKTKGKKYDAILENKKTGNTKTVSFGDAAYNHYEDTTGLGLYKHKNTLDKERRRLYRLRHAGEDKNKFSSGYFSMKFLW